MANIPTNTGVPGVELIKSFEGLRLDKYQDAIGKWTIGYGHLILPNENFPRPLMLQEAEDLLRADLGMTERGIRQMVKVDLNQNQFDALVSFAFNLGPANLKSSTLLRKVNSGDFNGAAEEFPKWNHAGGQVLAGLTARRNAEKNLFLS